MRFRVRLRTILASVAMASAVMISMRMSILEDQTFQGILIPTVSCALGGIWAARLRGWSIIAGGAGGGIVWAITNVATQYIYYHYFYFNPFATIIYAGPEICLIVDLAGGSIVGSLLGLSAWVVFRVGFDTRRS